MQLHCVHCVTKTMALSSSPLHETVSIPRPTPNHEPPDTLLLTYPTQGTAGSGLTSFHLWVGCPFKTQWDFQNLYHEREHPLTHPTS